VTDLTVTDDRAGARLALTTKAQGTGTIVIPGETAGDIWEVLDQLADLKERFHSPAASPGQEAGADEGGGGDPDDEAGADEGGGSDAGADEAGGV